jgi:hypothetical protein
LKLAENKFNTKNQHIPNEDLNIHSEIQIIGQKVNPILNERKNERRFSIIVLNNNKTLKQPNTVNLNFSSTPTLTPYQRQMKNEKSQIMKKIQTEYTKAYQIKEDTVFPNL